MTVAELKEILAACNDEFQVYITVRHNDGVLYLDTKPDDVYQLHDRVDIRIDVAD